MSRRRINPDTGEVELTYREEKLVDEYIKNGGNGKAAAEAAGYGTARADRSAYQVLRRAEVQRRIRDHSLESRVSSEEIIGTLVSCMRGNLGRCSMRKATSTSIWSRISGLTTSLIPSAKPLARSEDGMASHQKSSQTTESSSTRRYRPLPSLADSWASIATPGNPIP
jgi:hypothetical protein